MNLLVKQLKTNLILKTPFLFSCKQQPSNNLFSFATVKRTFSTQPSPHQFSSQEHKDNVKHVVDHTKDTLEDLMKKSIIYDKTQPQQQQQQQNETTSMGEIITEKAQETKDTVPLFKDSTSSILNSSVDQTKEVNPSIDETLIKDSASNIINESKDKLTQTADPKILDDKIIKEEKIMHDAQAEPPKEPNPKFPFSEIITLKPNKEEKTIIEEILEDHNSIRAFIEQYRQNFASRNFSQAEKWVNQLGWLVAQHSVAEEIVLYPFLQSHHIEIQQNLREHQLIKENFCTLEKQLLTSEKNSNNKNNNNNNNAIESPSVQKLINELIETLCTHMEAEERELKLLEKYCLFSEELFLQAKRFHRRKLLAPTHPHPAFPNQIPLFETLAGFLALPVDVLRDFFFKEFPSKEEVNKAIKK